MTIYSKPLTMTITEKEVCYLMPMSVPFPPFLRNSVGFLFGQLVSWCFEPSQPQRITSGPNTNMNLSPSYSFHKSLYHESLFLEPKLKFYPQFGTRFQKKKRRRERKKNTCLGAYLYSAGTQD